MNSAHLHKGESHMPTGKIETWSEPNGLTQLFSRLVKLTSQIKNPTQMSIDNGGNWIQVPGLLDLDPGLLQPSLGSQAKHGVPMMCRRIPKQASTRTAL